MVMDQFTRRIVGFGIHRGVVDGAALCRMFQEAIRQKPLPKYLPSTDNDPLDRFHPWEANLRVLDAIKVKTVPTDRIIAAGFTLLVRPVRVLRSAMILRPV